jgi:hypothetical protein
MNRLIVFIASVSLACLAISSTCLAMPAGWQPDPIAVADAGSSRVQVLAPGLPAMGAASTFIGGGILSL